MGAFDDLVPGSQPGAFDDLIPDKGRSFGSQVARQAGLATRYAVEGLASLPNMIGDAVNKIISDPGVLVGAPPGMASTGINLGSPSQATSDLLTAAGLPQPQTPTERVVGAVSKGLASTGSVIKGAAAMPGEIAAALQARPAAQAAATAAGAATTQGSREAGLSPSTSEILGLLAGFGAPALADAGGVALSAVARGAPQLAAPFTQAGRERIVGAALNRLAADSTSAQDNLDNAAQFVPGSMPTTAQTSKDVGLLQAERALAAQDPQFAMRKSANNAARNNFLDEIAGTPQDLDYYKQARAATAQDLYQRALDEEPTLTPWIKGQLTQLAQRHAFQAAQDEAIDLAKNQGLALDNSNVTQVAHYTKMALDDMIERAVRTGNNNAARGLVDTRDKLVSLIESKDFSPSYREARSTYAAMSEPIEQLGTLQDIRQRTQLPGPDVTGQPIFSQAKWQNVVSKNIDDLRDKLTPEQINRLQRIGDDLDLASLSDNAGRATGSNTFQNLSTANVLGAALGGKFSDNAVLQSLARPLQWLYKIPEPQVRDLLSQAMLEPALARALMAKGTPSNVEFLGAALLDKWKRMGQGAALGTNAALQPQ